MEEMDVDLSIDRTYRLLLNWFRSQQDIKVKDHSKSEFIKVRVSHWSWRGEIPCEVNVNIEPKKTKITHIVFNFNFFEMGAVTTVTTAIALVLVGIFFGLDTVAFCVIPLIFALLSIQQDIGKRKRRFMDRIRDSLTGGITRVQDRQDSEQKKMLTENLSQKN